MSTKSLFTSIYSSEAATKMVETGEDEARILRQQIRKQRLKRDVRRDLKARQVLAGLMKGAVIRKNWDMYSSILSRCNTEE